MRTCLSQAVMGVVESLFKMSAGKLFLYQEGEEEEEDEEDIDSSRGEGRRRGG